MRRVHIRRAPAGAVLAQPLVDERGALVLAAGRPLVPAVVERLWDRDFRYAYIEEFGFEGLAVQEPLQPQLYARARRLTQQLVDEVQQARTLSKVKLPLDELETLAADVCEDLARIPAGAGFLLYPGWGVARDERLSFVINAGVLAAYIAMAIDGGTTEARHLFMAALLQDIGMWKVATEHEHVTVAKNLLRPMRDVSALVKAVVSQHHERLDGSGYPEGKTGDQLHPLAQIMSVVVAYLELLGARRGPLPHDAQEALMAGVGVEFDKEAVSTLVKCVPAYPVGTVLRLSNRYEAVVVHPGPPGLNRPRVRLLPPAHRRIDEYDVEKGGEQAEDELVEIELSTEYTLAIEEVLQ